MAHPLHASRPRTFGIHNLGGRNYDYTQLYNPDKLGEELKENARVWYVYLDEAGSHDADMIEGFQSILESLLVFAALFSAVVTTFVAQTSQVLQPDNAQIMVSLLVETNQLLRAVGNGSNINAVPAASLGPKSRTHTSKDAWVNGLFFTSLALSLSTALLSVLAKQWIQAYIATVSGDAKTRALIRQFRFEGLEKWKLSTIIEILPLILHCSVAVFLVGLALYVSQLSRPICGIVAGITAVTFLFYFVSSVLPAFYIACPYRIPFMFALVQLLSFTLRTTRWGCLRLWYMLPNNFNHGSQIRPWRPRWMGRKHLKNAEHDAVFEQLHPNDRLAYNSLVWVFNNSSNRFVKEVVIEGTCGLLDEWSTRRKELSFYPPQSGYLDPRSGNSHFLSAIKYSLSRLPDTYSASSMEDEIGNNKYGRLIKTFMTTFDLKTLLDEPTAAFKDRQESIRAKLSVAYKEALRYKHRVLSRWLLDLGGPNLFKSGWNARFLFSCTDYGDTEDFCELVHRGIDLTCRNSLGRTALHWATEAGNLDVVNALVEQEPALISARSHSGSTALDYAIVGWGNFDIAGVLLDHCAQLSNHDELHDELVHFGHQKKVTLLLDRGWDRTVKDAQGKTLLDIACSKGDDTLVEYLEHYQTVRFAPYGMKSHTVNEETP